jgi:NADPH-dependent 2,4-dienoyl-CoA reductase/sulfur reductase-like enzyme
MGTKFDCDVLIAGGGPTGVTLAVLLAQRGVKVIVADKEADIYPLPAPPISTTKECGFCRKPGWPTR